MILAFEIFNTEAPLNFCYPINVDSPTTTDSVNDKEMLSEFNETRSVASDGAKGHIFRSEDMIIAAVIQPLVIIVEIAVMLAVIEL